MKVLDQRIEDAQTQLLWTRHESKIIELNLRGARECERITAELCLALDELRHEREED